MISKQELIQYIEKIIEGSRYKSIPEQSGAYYAALIIVWTHLECESISNSSESGWTDRVEKEKTELYNRICKLADFLKDGEKIADLSPQMLHLLSEQLKAMKQYYYILEERIRVEEKHAE